MTDRGIILPASVVRMIYIPLSLSFSASDPPSLPFRKRNPDVGLRSGRFVKATVPCHGRRSMTIAMCPAANLRALISFGGHHSITAAWRFRCSPPLFGAGTVFVCYSIQSGYYRTRCTRPDLSIRRDESAFYDYFLDI